MSTLLSRLLPCLTLPLLLALAAPAAAQKAEKKEEKKAEPGKGDRYALVVGVRLYKKGELRPLEYAEKGAAALADLLKKAGYRRVVLMTYTAAADNVDLLPTARNIRKQLAGLLEDCGPDDTALVAFTGHGAQPEDGKDYYLCPVDAELGEKKTLLPVGDLYEQLGKSKAGTKLLIVDACYPLPEAQLSVTRLAPRPRPQGLDVPKGTHVLYSCGPGQFSYESKRLEQGVFWHYLLEGLRGGARAKGGAIDLDRLVRYLQDEVPDRAREAGGPRARQVPTLLGEPGKAVLLTRMRPSPGPVGLRPRTVGR